MSKDSGPNFIMDLDDSKGQSEEIQKFMDFIKKLTADFEKKAADQMELWEDTLPNPVLRTKGIIHAHNACLARFLNAAWDEIAEMQQNPVYLRAIMEMYMEVLMQLQVTLNIYKDNLPQKEKAEVEMAGIKALKIKQQEMMKRKAAND